MIVELTAVPRRPSQARGLRRIPTVLRVSSPGGNGRGARQGGRPRLRPQRAKGGGDMPTNINDKVISGASEIDDQTIRQAEKAARLPIVEGHVALMPDAHVGIGATVGSV